MLAQRPGIAQPRENPQVILPMAVVVAEMLVAATVPLEAIPTAVPGADRARPESVMAMSRAHFILS